MRHHQVDLNDRYFERAGVNISTRQDLSVCLLLVLLFLLLLLLFLVVAVAVVAVAVVAVAANFVVADLVAVVLVRSRWLLGWVRWMV